MKWVWSAKIYACNGLGAIVAPWTNRRYEVECDKSYQMVNVRGLMEDFPDNLQQWEEKERISGIYRPDFGDSSSIQFNINVNGKQMTQDSSKTNNFNGPMSGVIGSDNATVSNNAFIQNNNANTAELLQLISSMRETASQFPEDVRDGIILDIEAVEAEIKKPEKERENTRLKTILKRILAAGTAIGIGVVGVTEFANTAIDVGKKLGIELSLPSVR